MFFRWLFALLHLLALGVGLGAIWGRSRALRALPAADALRRVFYTDTLWAVAGALWLLTGLARAFGGFEKGAAYYLATPVFHAKMGAFVLVLLLEVAPLLAIIRWRARSRRGLPIDTAKAGTYARISAVQAVLVVVMVGLAAALARGMQP